MATGDRCFDLLEFKPERLNPISKLSQMFSPKSGSMSANPTHVAVALRYKQHEGAPTVTTKGLRRDRAADQKAGQGRGIPIIEKPSLGARARRARTRWAGDSGRPLRGSRRAARHGLSPQESRYSRLISGDAGPRRTPARLPVSGLQKRGLSQSCVDARDRR